MKITKFGQSCLLIEIDGARIIMDPGAFSTAQNELKNINMVLITHDHMDHVEMNSMKAIVANNPGVKIYTTATVQDMLKKDGIDSIVLKNRESVIEKGITIEGIGEKHAVLINSMPQSENVGFIIADRFFYPGDALTLPDRKIEVLALPAAAPWAKLSEIVDYAIVVKPKVAFPVHDSILADPSMMQGMMVNILQNVGVMFQPVELNKEYEF